MNREIIRFVQQLASATEKLSDDEDLTEKLKAYLSGYADALRNVKEFIESS